MAARENAEISILNSDLLLGGQQTELPADAHPFQYQGKAILWKTDGTEVSIPWGKLNDESKNFAKNEIKRLKDQL